MRDLERQVRAYAEQLDQAAPAVEDLSADSGSRLMLHRLGLKRSPWLSLAAAAVFVVVAVGGVAMLTSGLGTEDAEGSTTTGALSTTTAFSEDPVLFTPAVTSGDTQVPILVGGVGGDGWDYPFVDPGSVVEHGDAFHMFPVGSGEDRPGDEEESVGAGIGYAVSVDGTSWETQALLFTEADVPYADMLGANTVLIQPGGIWVMYFEAVIDPCTEHGDHCYEYRIARATAPAPSGPWTIDPTPVLETGPEGAWDAGFVSGPSVMVVDGGYVMYYSGGDKESSGGLGIARSEDGAVWVKDPEPVFGPSAPWESGAIRRPNVLRTPGGWVMTFAGRTGGNRGIAYSEDGLVWEAYPGNPILDGLMVELPAIFDTDLVYVDGQYRWYLGNGGHRSGSDVFLMVYDGEIPPS